MARMRHFLKRCPAVLLSAALLAAAVGTAAAADTPAPTLGIYTTGDMGGRLYREDPVTWEAVEYSYQNVASAMEAERASVDAALLLDNLELLEQFGFGCEDFGDGAILVREVPADLDAADTAATLEEFAQNLRTGRNLDEKREALLHTMACKAAIKGGWTSDPAELKILVEKVQSGEVRYCPHGRPVVVKVTKYELEKLFKRA